MSFISSKFDTNWCSPQYNKGGEWENVKEYTEQQVGWGETSKVIDSTYCVDPKQGILHIPAHLSSLSS